MVKADPIAPLKIALNRLPSGKLSERDAEAILNLLEDAWDELEGSADNKMNHDKLLGRIEDATWKRHISA